MGGLTLILVLYHAYAGGIGRKPSVVLLILAVVATDPLGRRTRAPEEDALAGSRRIRWTAPLLFAGGAIVLFAIGLLSALALAIFGSSRDWRGTAFGVAHAHYLIWVRRCSRCSAVRLLVAQVFGRLLGTRLTAWSAWLLFTGFNCTFFVQFLLGDKGQPAGASSFSAHGSISAYNMISTIGAAVTTLGVLAFLLAVARAHSGKRAGNDPWLGNTLSGTRPRRRRLTTSTPSPRSRAHARSPTCAARCGSAMLSGAARRASRRGRSSEAPSHRRGRDRPRYVPPGGQVGNVLPHH